MRREGGWGGVQVSRKKNRHKQGDVVMGGERDKGKWCGSGRGLGSLTE